MERIPEPELMDDAEQARAYATADFSEPHQAFVEHFKRRFPEQQPQNVLDLGCGPADVTIRFARAYPTCQLTGVDGAAAMLEFARQAIRAARLSSRIRLLNMRLPGNVSGRFDTVISNSLLHHLVDPSVLWQALATSAERGAAAFVMDLRRPETCGAATGLVEQYSGDEPDVLKRDFFNSLLAAYRPEEIHGQLGNAGLNDRLRVDVVSDRHLIVWGHLP